MTMTPIVQTNDAVTLVGGGHTSPEVIDIALYLAPILVAADSGADTALAAGHLPVAVIGDLDSISDKARAALPPSCLHLISEQDSTDFDKCLRNIKAPLILGVGFLGGRLDHELATLNVLVRRAGRPVILIGASEICFHCPPDLALTLPVGATVSLFPLSDLTAHSSGLRWPLDGIGFAPWGRSGTSNETSAPHVRISVSGAGMLVILSRDHLNEAIRALLPPTAD